MYIRYISGLRSLDIQCQSAKSGEHALPPIALLLLKKNQATLTPLSLRSTCFSLEGH